MASISEFSRLSAILTMDITGFMKNAEIAEAKLVQFGQKATKVGSTISRGLGLAFALVGGAAVSTASEFNKVSVQLRSLVGRGDFTKLSKQARQLGESTVFTRIEIVEAQKELAKLGTSGGEIQKIIPAISSLAGALDEDLAGSASAVKEALNIFRLEAKDSQRVTDLYAQAVQSSALTIPQLREGLKNIGPILKQQNVSLEDSVALLALLANSAIKGSTAGTKLRSTFNKLAKTYTDGNVALAKFTEGNLEYSEILGALNSRAAVVGAILQDQGGDLKDLQVLFQGAAGAAGRLSDEFEGELFFTVEQLKNAFQNLAIELGQTLVPATEILRDVFVGLARGFAELSPGTKTLIGTFIAMTPVIAGLTFVVGQLTIAFAALATTSGLIVVGLLAAAAAAAYFGGEISQAEKEAAKIANITADTEALLSAGDPSNIFATGSSTKLVELKSQLAAVQQQIEDTTEAQEYYLALGKRNTGSDNVSEQVRSLSSDLRELYLRNKDALVTLANDVTRLNSAIADQDEIVTARKTLNQIFADGAKLAADAEDAERGAAEASKKRTTLLQRAEDMLAKARNSQLPQYQKRLEEVNLQIDKLKRGLIEAGGTGNEINGIAAALREIAQLDIEADRASFLEDLNAQLAVLATGPVGGKLLGVTNQIKELAAAAAELGIPESDIKPLLNLLETRLTGQVFEEIEDDNNKKQKEARKEFTKFVSTDLQNRIQDHRDAVQQIVADANLSASEQREIYEKLEDDIRNFRKEALEEAEETTTNQLRVVRDFANAIGNAFSSAISNGTNFFKELTQAFLQFFSAIIGKLVALVTLYALLSAFSGGVTAAGSPTGLAKTAQSLMGDGGLSGFITGGLGFRSTSGGGGSMAGIGSRIDGQDIVLSNQMSGRQLTRIGG